MKTKMKNEVIVPTTHSNGSGARHLKDALEEAVRCVTVALDALAGARPHGRDYYVQGDVFAEAAKQHREQEQRLSETHDYLMGQWSAIDAQDRK